MPQTLVLLTCLCCFFAPHMRAKEPSRPLVAVTVSSYQLFLKQLLEGLANVHVCVPNTSSAHTWEPKPQDIIALKDTVLWFGTGEPFEKKLLEVLNEDTCRTRFVDLRVGVDLLYEHCCPHHKGTADPHIWMSPTRLIKQLTTIDVELQKTFPEHAQIIHDRAIILMQQLQELDTYIKKTLQDVKDTIFIVAHDAYGYYCQDYTIRQIPIEREGKECSTQQLLDIISLGKNHVHTIFTQKQYPTKAAEQIASHMGAKIKELDPYSSDYFQSMKEITQNIFEEGHYQQTRYHATSS